MKKRWRIPMKRYLKLLICLAVMFIAFYVLPLFIIDTGSAIFMLIMAIPFIAFVCSVVYGCITKAEFLLPPISALLFIPTIFIHYNSSAWVYTIAYAVVMYLGNLIGWLISKLFKGR